MVSNEDLREEARRLLEDERVKYVVGWRRGPDPFTAAPHFARTPGETADLVWGPTCVHNLVRFVRDEKRRSGRSKEADTRPVGIFVKGCDSRAVNVLLQEKFIERGDVHLIGLSCEKTGVIDEKKVKKLLGGEIPESLQWNEENELAVTAGGSTRTFPAAEVLAERCVECRANFPVVHDILFGKELKRSVPKPFASVEKMEELSWQERRAFWEEQMGRCIRCYACRSVCPMCFCDECVVDTINFAVTAATAAEEKADRIKWIERSNSPSENFGYHLVRAIHLAGRCIDCGECERVCPLDIPIRFLNKKLEKVSKEHFGYDAGFDPGGTALVSGFRDDDPGDFIR